jgi:hypothetical protein
MMQLHKFRYVSSNWFDALDYLYSMIPFWAAAADDPDGTVAAVAAASFD